MGYERFDGSAYLRQEGRADLPRPRDRAASGLQRGHGAQDRSRGQTVRHRGLWSCPGDPHAAQRAADGDGRGSARTRDTGRRTGPPHRRGRTAGRADADCASDSAGGAAFTKGEGAAVDGAADSASPRYAGISSKGDVRSLKWARLERALLLYATTCTRPLRTYFALR